MAAPFLWELSHGELKENKVCILKVMWKNTKKLFRPFFFLFPIWLFFHPCKFTHSNRRKEANTVLLVPLRRCVCSVHTTQSRLFCPDQLYFQIIRKVKEKCHKSSKNKKPVWSACFVLLNILRRKAQLNACWSAYIFSSFWYSCLCIFR